MHARRLALVTLLGSTSTLLATTGCSAEPSDDDVTEGSEIVTGQPGDTSEVPWTVALLDEDLLPTCSGVIVGARWILTAQRCLEHVSEGSRVAAGFDDLHALPISEDDAFLLGAGAGEPPPDGLLGEGQLTTVDAVHRLDGYTSPREGRDLALLHLATPLDFTFRGVRSISLPARDAAKPEPGTWATVSGWGGSSELGPSRSTALSTSLLTVGADPAIDARREGIEATFSDAAIYGVWDADLLPGDMGGPLTVGGLGREETLAGIASWRVGSAGTIFEWVVPHVAWIRETIATDTSVAPPSGLL